MPGTISVLDADVGEGAAHHHFVVATARAIAVEVGLGDLMFHQPFTGGAVGLDVAGGADVVGGDRIAQDQQRLGFDDVGTGAGSWSCLRSRAGWRHRSNRPPAVGFRTGDVDRLPVLVALVDVGIAGDEHRTVHAPAIVVATSSLVGQMSLRNTSTPSFDTPIGVVVKSSITVPFKA
jgi:hypothetical protein